MSGYTATRLQTAQKPLHDATFYVAAIFRLLVTRLHQQKPVVGASQESLNGHCYRDLACV